jgi:hypothetical protein
MFFSIEKSEVIKRKNILFLVSNEKKSVFTRLPPLGARTQRRRETKNWVNMEEESWRQSNFNVSASPLLTAREKLHAQTFRRALSMAVDSFGFIFRSRTKEQSRHDRTGKTTNMRETSEKFPRRLAARQFGAEL